jgi:uncharacterized protein (DUF1501 family)
VSRPDQLYKATRDPFFRKISEAGEATATNDLHYLYKTMAETTSSAAYIYEHSKTYQSTVEYPQTEFGRHLKEVATLIISGIDTKVYYISLGSFDTHANQLNMQNHLLQQLGDGLDAFTRRPETE